MAKRKDSECTQNPNNIEVPTSNSIEENCDYGEYEYENDYESEALVTECKESSLDTNKKAKVQRTDIKDIKKINLDKPLLFLPVDLPKSPRTRNANFYKQQSTEEVKDVAIKKLVQPVRKSNLKLSVQDFRNGLMQSMHMLEEESFDPSITFEMLGLQNAQNNKEEEEYFEDENEIWEEVDLDEEATEQLTDRIQEISVAINTDENTNNSKIKTEKASRRGIIYKHRIGLASWFLVGNKWLKYSHNPLVMAKILSHLPLHLHLNDLTVDVWDIIEWFHGRFLTAPTCNICNPPQIQSDLESYFESGEPILSRLYEGAELMSECSCLSPVILSALLNNFKIVNRLTWFLTPFNLRDKNAFSFKLWLEVNNPKSLKFVPIHPLYFLSPPYTIDKLVYNYSPSTTPNYVISFEMCRKRPVITDVTFRYFKQNLAHQLSRRKLYLSYKTDAKSSLQDWLAKMLSRYRFESFKPVSSLETNETKRYLKELSELESALISEKMPTKLSEFKSHPTYVLQKHIPKSRNLKPNSKPIAYFKGEKVFHRNNLIPVRSAKGWWYLGRVVHDDPTVPYDWKNLEAEELDVLYAESQTHLYQPPDLHSSDLKSGSRFALYVPTMLPPNTLHITWAEVVDAVKEADIYYLLAMTGFKRTGATATPDIEGVVIFKCDFDFFKGFYSKHQKTKKLQRAKTRYRRSLQLWATYIQFSKLKLRLENSYQT